LPTSTRIDNTISQEQLTQAYGWIRKAVDQGFAPAKEAEKLFIGRVPMPNLEGCIAAERAPVTLEKGADQVARGASKYTPS
jgi:hypothetical protein